MTLAMSSTLGEGCSRGNSYGQQQSSHRTQYQTSGAYRTSHKVPPNETIARLIDALSDFLQRGSAAACPFFITIDVP
jgi:hypothetical protein